MSKVLYEKRSEIPEEFTWDLSLMYADEEAWNKDYEKVMKLADDLEAYKGRLDESSQTMFKALEDSQEIYRLVSKLYSYSSMNLDQDTRVAESQALKDKALKAYVYVENKLSFFSPEVLSMEKDRLEGFFEENEKLELYRQSLNNLIRQKDHVLSPREESILAQMGEVAEASQQTFGMLNNADISFPSIKDENGEEVKITHGNFIPLMRSEDRRVREDAFKALYGSYDQFKNTFAQTLSGNSKYNIFEAKMRNFESARQASLFKNNVDTKVYDNLIDSVHENLDAMYKYMDIRKRALGLEELHMYDIYTPMLKDYQMEVEYEKAKDLILKGLNPLGQDYLKIVEEGFNNRWIDVYENTGKRSGAYSGGCYDSNPYILLNYQNELDSVFTTAHEMGHSIHSYLSRKNQAPVYGGYSIFVAEVASTTNEALLLDYLLENAESKEEKLYLLNHHLEQFRSTVFRQTMFAEFEKIIYEHVEAGGSLTADYLSKVYKELNELYYGPNMVVDEEIALEWARIPHFYYNFYVFQYATGYSAAMAFSQKILNEGQEAVDKYLGFLKAGSSDYPINVLKTAGVDMNTKKPVDDALKIFRKLVDEMDKLI